MTKQQPQEPKVIEASKTFKSLVGALNQQFQQALTQAMQEEAEERGYPPEAQFDLRQGKWLLPPGTDDKT